MAELNGSPTDNNATLFKQGYDWRAQAEVSDTGGGGGRLGSVRIAPGDARHRQQPRPSGSSTPSPASPREIDVIESYGPSKPAGAQVGSHICYDDSPETASNACAATGRGPELWPVADAFPKGAGPWDVSWEYAAEFTIGGDTVRFSAADGTGNELYSVNTLPTPAVSPATDPAPPEAVQQGRRSAVRRIRRTAAQHVRRLGQGRGRLP